MMGMMTMNELLFQKVKCRAFLKKANDGAHIDIRGDSFYFCKGRTEKELTEPGQGGNKTYYERTDKLFTGVVVGLKEITLEGRLFIKERRDSKGNTLRRLVGEETVESVYAACVYYANMKKRWVMIDDIIGFENGIQISIDMNNEERKPKKKTEYIVVEPESEPFTFLSDDDIPF